MTDKTASVLSGFGWRASEIMPSQVERRHHPRMALKTRAYFIHGTREGLIEAQMVNIGVGGLYCLTSERFNVGETFQCLVSLTSGLHPTGNSYLRGNVRVIRVDNSSDLQRPYGVACQMQSYDILPPNAFRIPPHG